MAFNPKVNRGQVLSNHDIVSIFGCGIQGGMRRSHQTNSLVMISDHTRGIYKDRWEGNTLHYTGMGLTGHQHINASQNRTLSESRQNIIGLYLFEVFKAGEYIYQGKVELVGEPYKEKQLDTQSKVRDVWMFPLRLVGHEKPTAIDENVYISESNRRERNASKLSDPELQSRIDNTSKKPGTRYVTSKQYDRNEYVAEKAKRRANGKCQLCGNVAPFRDNNHKPYLEIHHIKWLSQGGHDTIQNTVALCPNCHRKMHILDFTEDRGILIGKTAAF